MAKITNSEDVIKKLEEFDKYVSQSMDVLKSLRAINEDLLKKKGELIRYETELFSLREKCRTIKEEADAILSPMRREKEELKRLDERLTNDVSEITKTFKANIKEGFEVHIATVKQEIDKMTRVKAELQQRAEEVSAIYLESAKSERERLSENQRIFQVAVHESIEVVRKELDSQIADFLYKQNALVSNLTQQIDGYQRLTDALKSGIEGQSHQISQLEHQNAKLQTMIEGLSEEFNTKLTELQDGRIQQLERESAQMRTSISGLVERLNNVKFKKFLGL